MTMGERLKELRLKRNLSQEEVARQIGITRSAYSHYEINNRQPVYETLIKLSDFFGVSVDYMIGGVHSRGAPQVTPEAIEIIRLLDDMDQEKRQKSLDKIRDAIRQAD
ncbi:Xre family transcriptional regulator [Paenibacillus sp. 32O-W]|jgi:Predicted transcriptional regulators|nr:helix-turn-helix transcriptional regulator [Paenibacillus sp. 32O-W]ALS27853.1 Xre family transcriptional regulator [Paenibacillus sp. 32O-W]